MLGLGAAVLMPLTMAVLTVLFDPAERARALTVWVTANALGIPLGPLVGGWLLDHFWWGSVFLINVPLVVVGLVAVAACGARVARRPRPRLDPPGRAALQRPGLVALTYGIIEAGARAGRPAIALAMAGGRRAARAFVVWQRRARAPLVDLALFRSRAFTWGTVLATVASFGCSACSSRCRSTSRRSAATTRSAPACGCCR